MPGKSRRKAKYSVQNLKQSKSAQAKPVVQSFEGGTQVNQATVVSNPAPSPKIVTASPRVAPVRTARGAAQAKAAVLPTVHVSKELRTIGILALLMLIVVIVLARILG